jgi:hypothetical protein
MCTPRRYSERCSSIGLSLIFFENLGSDVRRDLNDWILLIICKILRCYCSLEILNCRSPYGPTQNTKILFFPSKRYQLLSLFTQSNLMSRSTQVFLLVVIAYMCYLFWYGNANRIPTYTEIVPWHPAVPGPSPPTRSLSSAEKLFDGMS